MFYAVSRAKIKKRARPIKLNNPQKSWQTIWSRAEEPVFWKQQLGGEEGPWPYACVCFSQQTRCWCNYGWVSVKQQAVAIMLKRDGKAEKSFTVFRFKFWINNRDDPKTSVCRFCPLFIDILKRNNSSSWLEISAAVFVNSVQWVDSWLARLFHVTGTQVFAHCVHFLSLFPLNSCQIRPALLLTVSSYL